MIINVHMHVVMSAALRSFHIRLLALSLLDDEKFIDTRVCSLAEMTTIKLF